MSDNYMAGYVANCFNGITLPGSAGVAGDTGNTGADGASILYNNHTAVGDADNANPQTLMTYTLDNTPTVQLDSSGDMLQIDAYFLIADTTITGTVSLTFGATTLVTCTVPETPNRTQAIKLRALVTRTGAATQSIEASYTIATYPESSQNIPITTAAEDWTADIDIDAISNKDVSGGVKEVYCECLRITKYAI